MEKKYVIVYYQDAFSCNECGEPSNAIVEKYDNELEMHERADKVLKGKGIIIFSGICKTEFRYNPVNEIVKYKPSIVK